MEAFELRMYDSRINRWLSPDPAGQYPSPYLSMGNNWISRIDPDGGADNPVYDSKGNYRGNTIEGFKGEAIIYDGNADFSTLTKNELVDAGGVFLSTYSFNSPLFRDKIETHFANFKLGDGLDLKQKVSIKSANIGSNLYEADTSNSNLNVFRGIDKNGRSNADKYYKPTVENIRNVINLHEVGGHLLDGITDTQLHYLVVLKQINHSQFQSTTQDFQGKTLRTLYQMNPKFVLENPRLHKLYYDIGHPWWTKFNKN